MLSTGPGRKIVDLLFGRLDGRTASFEVTRELVQRYFPGDYRVIQPGAELVPRAQREETETVEILFSHEEERGSLRLFLRALRKLPHELPWQGTVWSRDPAAEPAVPLAKPIRDRVHFVGPQQGAEAQFLARADIVVAASAGTSPAPQLVLRAL